MSYGPNADAAEWMAKKVWPIVHGVHAEARLLLVAPSHRIGEGARKP
jgi:hypothetical protein